MQPSPTTPRIAPAAPPYPAEVEAALHAMMPPGSDLEPLRAFRTLARHLPLAEAMLPLGRFLLGRALPIGMRERELLIDRVCARCGCEYEWGVHALYFGARVGLTPEELAATVTAGGGDPIWAERDRLLVRLVDELHDTAQVSDGLWTALARHWTEPQLLAMLLLVGWYHAISFVLNGARVELEAYAPRFPDKNRPVA